MIFFKTSSFPMMKFLAESPSATLASIQSALNGEKISVHENSTTSSTGAEFTLLCCSYSNEIGATIRLWCYARSMAIIFIRCCKRIETCSFTSTGWSPSSISITACITWVPWIIIIWSMCYNQIRELAIYVSHSRLAITCFNK